MLTKHIFNRCRIVAQLLFIGTGVCLLFSSQVHAEYFGLPSGRSANIASHPSSSIEAGFLTGDVGEASYQGFGARFNYRTSPDLIIYGDVGQIDVEDADGIGYGAGFLYQIKGIAKTNDVAMKVSYHTIKLEEDRRQPNKGNVLAIEGLISGANIGESDLRWYANFGIHKFDFDGYDESEIGFGGGVFKETSFGEFYAGADLIDELTFGLGVRYHLQ